MRFRPPARCAASAFVIAPLACTSSEVYSSSTASRSAANPTTVENPNASFHTARQWFAEATASSNTALACSYGASTPIRTASGPSTTTAFAASNASSMLCRAISSCALALSASASSGNPVASAFASSARIRPSIRDSGFRSRPPGEGDPADPAAPAAWSSGSNAGSRNNSRYNSRTVVAYENRSPRAPASPVGTSATCASHRAPAPAPRPPPPRLSANQRTDQTHMRLVQLPPHHPHDVRGLPPRFQADATNSSPRRASSASAEGSAASRDAPVSRVSSPESYRAERKARSTVPDVLTRPIVPRHHITRKCQPRVDAPSLSTYG